MISSILVANRGEIALRIFRTAHTLGLTTVAVHSNVDTHHLCADFAVALTGSSPAETYLRGDRVIAAALVAGADAIHPGYGFLSENAAFAQAVIDAGLTWIGPPPSAITAMASKVDARTLVSALGIPILTEIRLPADALSDVDGQRLYAAGHDEMAHSESGAEGSLDGGADLPDGIRLRFPLIIKASAGGGGRGMRIVRSHEEFADAATLARAEALNAFGDLTIFAEPYIENGHHIEVQVLADTHGTVWALGERECSTQRRHQKVIEEAPSPLIERHPGLRDKLFEAAITAAKAVGYVGAGTVEFLVPADGSAFYFLEMNTRLQVEHPVTEAVTGLDLVELQIRIANGEPLTGEPPTPQGHAIEARLYAEDSSFTPQAGTLHRIEFPGYVRVDSGYANGDTISTHYDAMLAKVIAHAPTRDSAIAKLSRALKDAILHGPTTNRDLLIDVLADPTFKAGTLHTSYLEATFAPSTPSHELATLAAALTVPSGFRNVRSQPVTRAYSTGSVTYHLDRDGLRATDFPNVRLVNAAPTQVILARDGVEIRFHISSYGDDTIFVDSPLGSVSLKRIPRFTDPAATQVPGTLNAPMPGTVTEVLVKSGEMVHKGQTLIRLEAMKMQHSVNAPTDGTVAELNVQTGQQVDAGAPLIVIQEES